MLRVILIIVLALIAGMIATRRGVTRAQLASAVIATLAGVAWAARTPGPWGVGVAAIGLSVLLMSGLRRWQHA